MTRIKKRYNKMTDGKEIRIGYAENKLNDAELILKSVLTQKKIKFKND